MQKNNLNPKWITQDIGTRLYQIPVPIVGLTGGIATGKSTVANLFNEKKVPVIDADQLVKRVYQKDEVLTFIRDEFPTCMDGAQINFPRLREIAFKQKENIAKIETAIYRFLPSEFKKCYEKIKADPNGPLNNTNFIIYDVPLLFEKNLAPLVDMSLCVYSPRELQRKRLMKRDQINSTLADQILNNQMDIEEKKMKSDLCIQNLSDNLIDLKIEFDRIFKLMTS